MRRVVRISLKTLLVIVLSFCVLNIISSYAAENIFKISAISVKEKSSGVTVNDVDLNGDEIVNDVEFSDVTDYITYDLKLKNTTSDNYTIISITDNNSSEYLKYTYDDLSNTVLNAGQEKDFNLTITYIKQATDPELATGATNLIITYEKENGEEEQEEVTPSVDPGKDDKGSPQTNDNIIIYYILGSASLICLIILSKNKKKSKLLVLAIAVLLPVCVKANVIKLTVKFTNTIKAVSYDIEIDLGNGTFINYRSIAKNGKLPKPETPIKRGYTFDNWYKGSEVYDFNTPITESIQLEARFTKDTYTISYDLDGGSLDEGKSNPTTYDIDSDITLFNPTKTGHVFSGWQLEGSSEIQSTVRIVDETGIKSYKAIYTPINYTVTFDPNNGESTFTQSVAYGSKASIPTAPQYTGYTFNYWKLNDAQYDFNTPITGSITLIATYNPNGDTLYTVHHRYRHLNDSGFDTEDEELHGETGDTVDLAFKNKTGFDNPTTTKQLTILPDGSASAEYIYERTSYTFTLTDPAGDVTSTKTSGSYPFETSITLTANNKTGYTFVKWSNDETINPYTVSLTNNLTISPVYEKNTYHVTFNPNNGEESTVSDVLYQDLVSQPSTDPSKNGYTFDGWYNGNSLYNFSTPVEEDIELTAHYTPETYDIYYILPTGASVATANPTTYTIEDTFTLNNPSKEGYTFTGWSIGSSSEQSTEVTVSNQYGELTFTAHFEPRNDIAFNVIHKYKNLTGSTPEYVNTIEIPGTGTADTEVVAPLNHVDGYIDPQIGTVYILPNGEGYKEYIYERDTYELSVSDRTYVSDQSTVDGTYDFEEEITLIANDRLGYTFSGWQLEGEQEYVSTNNTYTFNISGDTTITPIYTANTNTPYTITHKYANLPGSQEEFDIVVRNLTGTTDTTVAAPVEPREGFNTPTEGTVTILGNGEGNKTYIYNRIEYTLTVTDRTNLDNASTANGSYGYDTPITLTANSVDGYTFMGWRIGSEETYVSTDTTYSFNLRDNVTITPVYEINSYSVTFDYNNGDGYGYETVTHGNTVSRPTPNPSKTGYTFNYWTYNNAEFDFDTPITDNITLIANYSLDTYTISYDLDGGSLETSNPESYTYESASFTLNNPTKTGHVFSGWQLEGSEDVVSTVTIFKETGDKSYKAIYTPINYTITFNPDNGESTFTDHADYGTTVSEPEAPSKTGFTFNYWALNDVQYNFSTLVTGDITLVAKYTANGDTLYTVHHKYRHLNDSGFDTEDEELYGETGDVVDLAFNSKPGFVNPTTTKQLEILPDGSASETYIYEREEYTLNISDRTYVDSSSTANGDYKYETPITLVAKNRAGYTFAGWQLDGELDYVSAETTYEFNIDSDVTILPVYTANTNTAYTVVHRYMNLEGSQEPYEDVIVPATGTTDTSVTPAIRHVDGFIDPETDSLTITGDGEASITYIYEREEYTLTVSDRTYVESSSTANGNYEFETPITLTAKSRAGYTFNGWLIAGEQDYISTSTTYEFNINDDVTIAPVYTANTNTSYSVVHKYKNLEGSQEEYDVVTVPGTGTTDTTIPALIVHRDGFVDPEVGTVTITGDGNGTKEYIYYRETYSLSVPNRTYVDSSSTADGTYEFETPITLVAANRAGYTFNGWQLDGKSGYVSTSNTYEFNIDDDITINPVYSANTNTQYKVLHRYMNLPGSQEEYDEVEVTGTGTTDTTVTATIRHQDGFVDPTEGTITITGDGQATKVYVYEREEYTLTISDRTYVDSSSTANGTYEFETPITLIAENRDGYTFNGWQLDGESGYVSTSNTYEFNIDDDITINPVYSANTNTQYKVLHRYMNLPGSQEEYDEVEVTGTGTTDTTVTATIRHQDGFVDPTEGTITITGDGQATKVYVYQRVTYSFTLTDPDGDVTSTHNTGTYPHGTEITLTANSKTGYTFTKWSNDVTTNPYQITLTGNVSISPVYTINNYTVTFNYNNGDADTYETVQYNNTVSEPQVTPTKTGYTFDYWTLNNQEYDFDDPVTSDIELIAHYTINTYSISYDLDGGTVSSTNPISYTYETPSFTLNNPTKEGYVFSGWQLVGSETVSTTVTIYQETGNKSYLATYTPIAYTITYNLNGGTVSTSNPTTYNITTETFTLNNPTKSGYEFTGWTGANGSTPEITVSVTKGSTGNKTYNANYIQQGELPIICKKALTLHTETCSSTSGSTTGHGCRDNGFSAGATITYGNIINSDNYVPGDAYDCNVDGTGYNQRFYYIRTLNGNAVLISNTNFTAASGQSDINTSGLYSWALDQLPTTTQWSNLPVTFDSKAARLITQEDLISMTGVTTINDLVPNWSLGNYKFLFENSNYSGVGDRSTQWIAETATGERSRYRNDTGGIGTLTSSAGTTSKNPVRPVIEIPLEQLEHDNYIIRFDAQGGTVNNEYVSVLKESSIGVLPAATKANATFGGWYTSTQYTTQIDENTVPTGYVTYYARWVLDVSNAVLNHDSFIIDLGSNAQITVTNAGDIELEPYTFTSNDTDVVTVNNNGEITTVGLGSTTISMTGTNSSIVRTINVSVIEDSSDYVLSFVTAADIEKDDEIISVNPDSISDMNVEKNTAVSGLPQPDSNFNPGYTFDGWYTNISFTTEIKDGDIIDDNMTLYAKWIPTDAQAVLNGNKYYTVIQNAVNAAPYTQSTIDILKDVSQSTSIADLYTEQTNNDKNITFDLHGHELYINSTSNARYAFRSRANIVIKNGTIGTRAAAAPVEANTGSLVLDNVRVYATGTRQGIYIKTDKNKSKLGAPVVEIRGGSIIEAKAQDDRGTVHVASGSLIIKDATISSTTKYAIYVESGSVTIGTKDGLVSLATPTIIGDQYGVGVKNSANLITFYDGVIKGITAAVENQSTVIPDDTYIEDNTQIASEEDALGYKVIYLIPINNDYVIQFKYDEEDEIPADTTYITPGDSITSEYVGSLNPTKTGYTFDCWYSDTTSKTCVNFPVTPEDDIVYYAKWTANTPVDVVDTFNISTQALQSYFANVNTWVDGATSSNYTAFKSSMSDNFTTNSCSSCCTGSGCDNINNCNSPTTGDKCEQSLGYDTGVTTGITVRISNESTKVKNGAVVNYLTIENGKIYNMIPGETYYWESNNDSNVYGFVKATGERRTIYSSVRNVRDLGGMATTFVRDNTTKTGTINYGRLYRGAKIDSSADVTSLTNLGITREIDLRPDSERAGAPRLSKHDKSNTDTVTSATDIIMHNYLIYPDTNMSYYKELRDTIKTVMEDIVNDNSENIFFHCTIGTDRTGTLAYFLEGLLGVSEEDRLEDYELTYYFGLLNRTRFHDNLSGSSLNPRFYTMYDTYKTNEDIYNVYMYGLSGIKNPTASDLSSLTKQQLLDFADGLGLTGYDENNTEAEILAAIEAQLEIEKALIESFRDKMITYN